MMIVLIKQFRFVLVLPFSASTDAFFRVAGTADHSTHCPTAATPAAFSVTRQVPYLSLAQAALAAVQSSFPVAFHLGQSPYNHPRLTFLLLFISSIL